MSRSEREARLKALHGERYPVALITLEHGRKRDRKKMLTEELRKYAESSAEPEGSYQLGTLTRKASGEVAERLAKLSAVKAIRGTHRPADLIHQLYGRARAWEEPALGAAHSAEALERARSYFGKLSKSALKDKTDKQGMLTVYRGITGTEGKHGTISVTLDPEIARMYSRQGKFVKKKIPLSEVLFYGRPFRTKNLYSSEFELVVPRRTLGRLPKHRPATGIPWQEVKRAPKKQLDAWDEATEELTRRLGRFPTSDEILDQVRGPELKEGTLPSYQEGSLAPYSAALEEAGKLRGPGAYVADMPMHAATFRRAARALAPYLGQTVTGLGLEGAGLANEYLDAGRALLNRRNPQAGFDATDLVANRIGIEQGLQEAEPHFLTRLRVGRSPLSPQMVRAMTR